jgi:serine/threonine protein kinase
VVKFLLLQLTVLPRSYKRLQGICNNMARNRAKEEPYQSPAPKTKFQYQKRPRRQWIVVQEFGAEGGGCNAGIAKVEVKDDPYDRYYIEKRFKPEHIGYGVAHKEISLLHQLSDWPGVVKMVDHFIDETRNRASVYLEYCDGKDLDEIIVASRGHNRVHERKIWKWLISLMDTLVYLHRGPEPEDDKKVLKYWNVIYHRDIKPSNIFLKSDFKNNELVAKLADFGCSDSGQWMFEHKKVQNANFASASTPGYEPPEHPLYSGASDVWQLALCIASVCTGVINPWSRHHPRGQRWNRSLPAGRYYSKELSEVLAWCLTDDTKRRPMPMEISKRLKEIYERINLPLDDQPLVALAKPGGQVAQLPQSVPSPRSRYDDQQPNIHDQRPGLHAHAFSDPELQRMEQRGNRYNYFVHGQRSPLQGHFPSEHRYGSGGIRPPGLPGGFIPLHAPDRLPPDFGSGEYSDSGRRRR